MIPLAGAIAIARERLLRARQVGADCVFDDLIALDGRFVATAGMHRVGDVYAAMRDEPLLSSNLGIEELRLLLTRVYSRDKTLWQQLVALHNVVARIRHEGIDFLRLLAEGHRHRRQLKPRRSSRLSNSLPRRTRLNGMSSNASGCLPCSNDNPLRISGSKCRRGSPASCSSCERATAAPTSRVHDRSTNPSWIGI